MQKGITSLPAVAHTASAQAIADCQRQALADQGDVWGLLDALSQADPRSFQWKGELDRILNSLLTRSRQRPQAFAGEVLDRLAAVSTFYLLRAELYLRQLTSEALPPDRNRPVSDAPAAVVEHLLPRYQELGRSTAEILHYRASIARQWALANAKDSESVRRHQKPETEARDSVIKPRPSKPPTNGHNGTSATGDRNGHTPPSAGNGRFSFPS